MSDATLTQPAWRLDWLSPMRCRLILVLLVALGFFSHLYYLHNDCPIDLSGDEAQYWDWSRNLDWSYYSKGPAVAYIIRTSCAIFGDTMPAVRYPALVFTALTSLTTYLLTRKLFGSEKLALGAVLLFHVVPMFIAGSVLMTIDPPMFFCWALATYFAAIAIFDEKPWMWVFVGAAIGLGFLAKYGIFLWFIGCFGFLLHCSRRRQPAVTRALTALFVAMLFTVPVIIWNYQNDWVSYRHVATQTGVSRASISLGSVAEMVFGQLGAVGPTMAIFLVAGIGYAIRRRDDPNRTKLLFLAWIGLSFFAINFLASFRTKVQANWPAPAYYTLTILAAYFISTKLASIQAWKPWRGWFWATVFIGVVFMPIAHDTSVIYPILQPIAERTKRDVGDLDPLARLYGWRELGQFVSAQLTELPPGSFVMCDDYQQTAEMAFYVRGQPITYCAGSYFGKRMSQYDVWENRRLDPGSPLVGRDAVYVGKGGRLPPEVTRAFSTIEKLPELPIVRGGVTVKTYKVWIGRGFRGLTRPRSQAEF